MKPGDGLKAVGAVFLVLSFTLTVMAAEKTTVVEAVKSDVADGLGLSADQKERIRAVREEYRARQQELKRALSLKNEALRQELDGDVPVRANIEAVVAQIKSIQGQITDNYVDVVLKLREVYTVKQIKRIKQRLEQRRKAAVGNKRGKKAKRPAGGAAGK